MGKAIAIDVDKTKSKKVGFHCFTIADLNRNNRAAARGVAIYGSLLFRGLSKLAIPFRSANNAAWVRFASCSLANIFPT